MLTPGIGYTFTNSPKGYSLEIEPQTQVIDAPFRVYEDSTAEGVSVIRISPGTINNQLPTVGGTLIGGASAYLSKPGSSGFVMLTIPASQSSGAPFPASTPQVTFNASIPSNSTSTAYVGLAYIKVTTVEGASVITIDQLVTGSLWGERFECGSQLDYWFSQI
jgi:hypothetical protein